MFAEVLHIHNTKMAELARGAGSPGQQQQHYLQGAAAAVQPDFRRSATDSQLDALRRVEVRSGGDSGVPGNGISEHQLQLGDLMPAGVEALRRVQSASDPLQADRLAAAAAAGDVVVPMDTQQWRGQQQKQQQQGLQPGAAMSSSSGGGGSDELPLPYRLQAVGHSLGAASLLMYAVWARMQGRPHHLRRLVLMSPAGFHPTTPLVRVLVVVGWGGGGSQPAGVPELSSTPCLCSSPLTPHPPPPPPPPRTPPPHLQGLIPCKYLLPPLTWLLDRTPGLRGRGIGLRLPSPLLRYLAFKLTQARRWRSLVGAGARAGAAPLPAAAARCLPLPAGSLLSTALRQN